jgi:CheY-like chemotaxis protein
LNPPAAPFRILVVAGESDTRMFLSNLLGGEGFATDLAVNVAEGLGMARQTPPDLIILDVMMPEKEGLRLYHHLKHDPVLKAVPVIMLSAIERKTFYLYAKFQAPPWGTGMPEPEAYLEKPPEADNLLHLVRVLTASYRAADAALPDEGEVTF